MVDEQRGSNLAEQIAAGGHTEIVITGVNTGDFGRTTGESFADLLRALDKVEGIERYRISSIEPNLLTDEIIDICARSPKFQPHFHIPIQSGCDRVLRDMRRRYNTAMFEARIEAVRKAMPDAFIGIDVIVGFPGETDDEFQTTYDFLERLAPAFLHIFPFSARANTPAAAMKNKDVLIPGGPIVWTGIQTAADHSFNHRHTQSLLAQLLGQLQKVHGFHRLTHHCVDGNSAQMFAKDGIHRFGQTTGMEGFVDHGKDMVLLGKRKNLLQMLRLKLRLQGRIAQSSLHRLQKQQFNFLHILTSIIYIFPIIAHSSRFANTYP